MVVLDYMTDVALFWIDYLQGLVEGAPIPTKIDKELPAPGPDGRYVLDPAQLLVALFAKTFKSRKTSFLRPFPYLPIARYIDATHLGKLSLTSMILAP